MIHDELKTQSRKYLPPEINIRCEFARNEVLVFHGDVVQSHGGFK